MIIAGLPKSWYRLVVLVTLVYSVFIRLPNINRPLLDAHYFRQTQTATVVRNFTLTGIDLFHTRLDIFGTGKEQILLLEFPFYEAITGVFSFFTGFNDYTGRFISLLFGTASGLVLLSIVNKLFSNRLVGFFALVFFLFNPLNFYFQQAYLIESTVIFLHLLSFYLWQRYAEERKKSLLVTGSLVTALAFIHKVVYAPFLLLPILACLYYRSGKQEFRNFSWLPGILLSLLVLLGWQYYTDVTNLANGHANFTLGDPSQSLWNFGTFEERLDIRVWTARLVFIQNSVTKYLWPMFFVGIFFLIVKKVKKKSIIFSWLLSMIFYYIVLFRIQSHDYYFMLVLPVFSIIAGYGLSELAKLAKNKYLVTTVICFYISSFIYRSIHNSQMYFKIDGKMKDRLDTYNKVLKKEGNILFVFEKYDWNSVYTYYTNHKGIVMAIKDISADTIPKLAAKGYRYVVIDGVSPAGISGNYRKLIDKDNLVILEI